MAFLRIDQNDLINILTKAGSVVSNWDVLCSYDVQTLNKVLHKEYEKKNLNTHLVFEAPPKKIMGFRYIVSCDIFFGSPTLAFSPNSSGFYEFDIPILHNSYCMESLNNHNETTTLSDKYRIVTTGPILSVKGGESDRNASPSEEIVEFGDHEEANLVLHFGKNLREVRVEGTRNGDFKEPESVYEAIKIHFIRNIKEVNYNLVQVYKNSPSGRDVMVTPKSFIFTTMADREDRRKGVLNIWIQTKESGFPQGNPAPSFFPNAPVLPVPLEHSSSIIFSHKLIYNNYLKPLLEQFYHVSFVDLVVDGTAHLDSLALVPKKDSIRRYYIDFPGVDFKQMNYEVDYNDHPFHVYTHNDQLHWVWNYQTPLKYVETKVVEDVGIGTAVGAVIGGIVGFLFGGPAGAVIGAGLGGEGGAAGGGLASGTVDKIVQNLRLNVTVNKAIPFISIDNTKFAANVNLNKEDILVDIHIDSTSGFTIFKRQDHIVDWDIVQSRFLPKLRESIYVPELDFGNLNYFAEANILFNDGNFVISPDEAVHFPYDTLVIGDVRIPGERRKKRSRLIRDTSMYLEPVSSSATKYTSPINSAINWIRNGFEQLKSFNPLNILNDNIQPQVSHHKVSNKTLSNVGGFDVNSLLLLSDLAIRSFTKSKPYYFAEETPSFVDAKAYSISLIDKFEESLASTNDLEFDPVSLMSKIEHEVINGNHAQVTAILHESISSKKSPITDDLEEKLDEIVRQHNVDFLANMSPEKSNEFVLKNSLDFVFCQ